jgi:hypothetical protein
VKRNKFIYPPLTVEAAKAVFTYKNWCRLYAIKADSSNGYGCHHTYRNTITEYWENLHNGVSGADMITNFDASKFKTRFACEIKNFEPTNFLDRKEARKLDRFTQTAVVASDQAVHDAGITADNVNPDRVGVVFASGIGGLITFQEEVTNFAKGDGTPRFQPVLYPENDLGHCRRPYFYAPWLPRTQLFGCKCLCFFYQRYDGSLQPYSVRQGLILLLPVDRKALFLKQVLVASTP